MKTGVFTRVFRVLFLAVPSLATLASLTAQTAQAQESFTVSGPLHSYLNVFNPAQSGTSFSATISYDPTVLLVNPLSTGLYDEVYFNEAVTQIEFAFFDSEGNELLRRIEEGISPEGKSTYIRALNDLNSGNGDELEYSAHGESGIHYADISIGFIESSGSLISELSTIPEPPALGQIDESTVSFLHLEFTIEGYPVAGIQAQGSITEIESGTAEPIPDPDPYKECVDLARNHGQFVSCVAQVSNQLRDEDTISGKEKGEHQRQAARSK